MKSSRTTQALASSVRGRRRTIPRSLRATWLRLEYLEDRRLLHAGGLDDVPSYLPPQHQLFDYDGYLTAPSQAPPISIAENYLRSHVSDLGLLPSDLDNYVVTTNYVTETTGATTLTFQQSLHGLEVVNANFNMTVSASGQLLNVGGGFVRGLGQRASQPLATPALSAQQAVVALADDFDLSPLHQPSVVSTGANGSATFSLPSLSLDTIPAKLRYVAVSGDEVALSWNLVVRTPDNLHWYNVDVDGNSGDLNALVDYASHAAYEVFGKPLESPSDGSRSVQNNPQVIAPVPAVIPSPFGWHDTDGIAGPEFTITRGNNVNAYADRDADDQPDTGSQPDGGAGLNFTGALVPFNPAQQPDTYTSAAVTNLFYWSNLLHDVHYLYGFTEAARNFQVNNYGRGGTGNDALDAEAQDGSGFNNANMLTPPDGTAPRMQMFEFDLTDPRRDSDFDAGVIVHEFGHGVSNRLTGNGFGLSALQSGGMGEGWSDWWALMLTQEVASETTSGRGVGTYLLGQPQNGVGIRDFRYDFDIGNANLETFLNYGIGAGQSVAVHDSGTRWAAALWDINHLFIQKYGFEPNVYSSTSNAGNIRALHLVMNALKIQALEPSFIDARDAILLADTMLYGGVDHFEIWTAFARRGLGEFASTSDSNSVLLTISFEIPDNVKPKISIADVVEFEGDSGTTSFAFNVIFTGTLGANVTVAYSTANGTAVAPNDHAAASGTLTFTVGGPTTQAVTVSVVGDVAVEPDETFFVNLSNVTNAVLTRSQATGTIKNDDVDVSINDVTVVEGDAGTKNAVFTISALGSTDRTVAVSYTTLNGTAIAGNDFLPAGGAVTFAPGGGTATVTVPIIGDKLNESTETFTVQLLSPQGSRLSKGVGVGTILDNDLVPGLYVNDVFLTTTSPDVLAAVFTVALGAPSGQLVTVEFATADGTALSGIDYISHAGVLTFAPGTTTQLVTVSVITSGVYSPNEKFSLNLFNPFHAQLGDPLGIATVIFSDPPFNERIIDDGDPGYSKTGGWVNLTNTLAYQLDYDYHAAGTGANFATWAFGSLPNGQYEVFAKWAAFSNRASNAPYTILDGLAPRGTVTIDQRIAPTGDQSNGITWQSLGLFSISNGSLSVSLGDNANGLVVADAIRIVADGIPPAEPEMDVAGSDRSIGTFDLSPAVDDGTDFGAVASNSNSVTHTFAITNTGNADLHLTGAPRVAVAGAHAADFTVLVQPGSSIAPGFQSTFQIIFHPSDSGLRQAVISIANDDDSEHPYTYAVQGTGVATGPAELTVDDVTSGFTAIGAWPANTNSLAFAGQHRSAPAGPGNSNTSWEFHGLAPGQYEVLTTWTPFNNRATNASYIIADGNVAETAVGVNQRQSPNDAFADGVMWESLALFQVTTGELTVRLNNNANGYIVADAVRIIRQGAAIAAVAPVVAHNSQLSLDVNGDTRITSSDALLVVNRLLSPQPAVSPLAALASPLATADGADSTYYLDVNGDGRVTARDALMVIGYLLNPSAQTSIIASPAASPATGQPSATTLAAVDQAIGQLDEPELEPAVSPLTTKASTPATDVAQQPASKTTQLLTPQSVRAYFASSAKKSQAKDSQAAML